MIIKKKVSKRMQLVSLNYLSGKIRRTKNINVKIHLKIPSSNLVTLFEWFKINVCFSSMQQPWAVQVIVDLLNLMTVYLRSCIPLGSDFMKERWIRSYWLYIFSLCVLITSYTEMKSYLLCYHYHYHSHLEGVHCVNHENDQRRS